MKTLDEDQIQHIAKAAMMDSGGVQWRAYEYAKMDLSSVYFDSEEDYENSLRRVADALKI